MSDPVRQWQLALLAHGYDMGPTGADGAFGPGTLRASLKVLNGEPGGNGKHALTEPAAFFAAVRTSFGLLRQAQVEGFNVLLEAMTRWPVSWVAYGFATAWHETAATMQPIREMGGDAYFKRLYDIEGSNPNLAKRLGNRERGDGARYAGRGYVQLTGRDNYTRYGIADDPDKAMQPACAAQIMVDGMATGRFTGKKLSDYLPGDYLNARRIINGTDKDDLVAGYARKFESALTAGGW